MITLIFAVLSRTPLWVWALLAALVALGLHALPLGGWPAWRWARH